MLRLKRQQGRTYDRGSPHDVYDLMEDKHDLGIVIIHYVEHPLEKVPLVVLCSPRRVVVNDPSFPSKIK